MGSSLCLTIHNVLFHYPSTTKLPFSSIRKSCRNDSLDLLLLHLLAEEQNYNFELHHGQKSIPMLEEPPS